MENKKGQKRKLTPQKTANKNKNFEYDVPVIENKNVKKVRKHPPTVEVTNSVDTNVKKADSNLLDSDRTLAADSKSIQTEAKTVSLSTDSKQNLRKETVSPQNTQEGGTSKLSKVKGKKVYGPAKDEDISSNWMQLKTILEKDKAVKKSTLHKRKPKIDKKNNHGGKKSMLQKEKPEPEKPPEIWFDDVDDILLENKPVSKGPDKGDKSNPLIKDDSYSGLTKAIAIDCEMVGVGSDSREDMLARVSVVNQYGHCIYDHFVQAQEKVTDYRTHVSGVRYKDMLKGKPFYEVCKDVANMMKGRILVGHAIHNDLKVMFLSHPRKDIRDTSTYKPFKQLFDGKTPSLKKLTAKVLSVQVQTGEHSSIQDAQAAMRLYTMHKAVWEKKLKSKRQFNNKRKKKAEKHSADDETNVDDID